ncbi:MAG: hypothetical protein KI785_08155 [Devosiaceae bacterium]|nr:hypothetical protein [Devosiaceae bacterium MH13]
MVGKRLQTLSAVMMGCLLGFCFYQYASSQLPTVETATTHSVAFEQTVQTKL